MQFMVPNDADRQALITYVRSRCEWLLDRREDSAPTVPKIEGAFGGVFVTFWRGRDLRGCMGSFERTHDIAASVASVAELSLCDPRFTTNPITADELAHIVIEISILSEPRRTDDPLSLIPGRHGIMIRRGIQSGCFLPKVAEERNWTASEFLSQCCIMKAGLPRDAWRDERTEVLLFEADVVLEQREVDNI